MPSSDPAAVQTSDPVTTAASLASASPPSEPCFKPSNAKLISVGLCFLGGWICDIQAAAPFLLALTFDSVSILL